MMIKTYKFKLYKSKKNKKLLNQIYLFARLYNYCIALHKKYYGITGKHLNSFKLKKHLTKLKKIKKFNWLNQLPSQAIQEVVERIDKGYSLFFQNSKLRKKGKSSRKVYAPCFKKARNYKSFTLKQAGYSLLENNKIRIGKQIFRYYKSREIEGNIKTLTIKRDKLGGIYLCFSCELEFKPLKLNSRPSKQAGFDFGLKTFLTGSDGNNFESPEFFKQGIKTIKKASKNLSRKKKGSNNKKRARKNLARIHKKVANQRRDFHFKLVRELCLNYNYLFFEDLNIEAMKRLWGRKISDLGFSSFMNILDYYSTLTETKVHKIDRWFPSSKTCFSCGFINKNLELKNREWICPSCKTQHNRDLNAAKNILKEGERALSPGVGKVRPGSQAFSVDSRIPRL